MNNPSYGSQVRKAFVMSRIMKWGFPFVLTTMFLLSFVTALINKSSVVLISGLTVTILGGIAIYLVGIQLCRCPKCGQLWWSPLSLGMGWLSLMMDAEVGGDETDSFVCRKCGLEIGPHLNSSELSE